MRNISFVLAGATGNLAALKLYPAISALKKEGSLKGQFKLIGVAHDNLTAEQFRAEVEEKTGGAFTDADYVRADFYHDTFDELEKHVLPGSSVIFYLSTGAGFFLPILENIRNCKTINTDRVKIIIEKPYGKDYENTIMVNQYIEAHFKENQIYRIDHYLGKEGMDALELVKKENHSRWNSDFIEEITFVLSEEAGIEERLDFYRETGAIADIVQNHIFQMILKVLTDSDYLRSSAIDSINEAFRQGRASFYGKKYLPIEKETMVYGTIILTGEKWNNLKIKLLTGKRMKKKETEIRIKFKDSNQPVIVDFLQGNHDLPEYGKLIEDCTEGKHDSFITAEEAEGTWIFGNQIRKEIEAKGEPELYKPDTVTTEDILDWIE